jgi:hypothetical protein
MPRAFQLTERDVALLRQVFRHRFAQAGHLHLLLGGSKRKIATRLRLLWQHGYLERPQALRTTRILMEELCYALGPAGARHLAHIDPALRALAELEWAETPRRTVGWPFIDHQLGVVDVLVSLAAACRTHGLTLEWDGHANRRRHALKAPDDEKGFLADAYFKLRLRGKVAHHYLELDRANVGLARMQERYARYFRYWQHRAATEPGFRFRVLTVTEPDHLRALRRVAREVGRDAAHPHTWRGLLFTHRRAFDLEHPDRIFDPIFFYADEERPVALL